MHKAFSKQEMNWASKLKQHFSEHCVKTKVNPTQTHQTQGTNTHGNLIKKDNNERVLENIVYTWKKPPVDSEILNFCQNNE